MSKTSNHIVRQAEAAGVSVDEYISAEEELRRQANEWAMLEARLSDAYLDRLDAPDGPLCGFDQWEAE